jgi:hypothetical protein
MDIWKGAKTDVSVSFIQDLFEGSTMTYGGDEEIVLKGGAKKSVKAGKTVK